MQRDFILFSQNNEDMIHCLCTIKERLLIFFSLSFTHFTTVNKKHRSLLSAKIGIDSSNYGKMDTF
jgi:hypothetical protein